MSDRKTDHIRLALESQTTPSTLLQQFVYEPLFSSHESALQNTKILETEFLGKTIKSPLWISSMTGGGANSGELNKIFAKSAKKFGLGMGLGSCRPIIENPKLISDFDVRSIIGEDLPLYSNLGHAQAEELLLGNELERINEMQEQLKTDGLILHINPLQEWFQPEGDRFKLSSIELIERLLAKLDCPIIVKEVGQGMGPKSLEALLNLPLAAIEFGAYGGTNFSKLELARNQEVIEEIDPMCFVGRTAEMMVSDVNEVVENLKNVSQKIPLIIISGGIQNYLHAFELMQATNCPAIYAQAGKILKHAQVSQESLDSYIKTQVEGLLMASAFLKLGKK